MAEEENQDIQNPRQDDRWEERTLNLLHHSKIDQHFVRAKKRTQRKKHKVRRMVENPMAIPQAILELQHPSMRESALRCLSDFLIWVFHSLSFSLWVVTIFFSHLAYRIILNCIFFLMPIEYMLNGFRHLVYGCFPFSYWQKREEDRENYDRTAFLLFNSCSTMAVLLQEVLAFSQLSVDGTPTVRASKRVVNVLTLFQCIASSKQTRYKFVKSFIPNFVVPLIRFEIPLENYEDVRAVALSVIGILCQAREPEVIQWALNSNMVEICRISMEIGSELSKVIGMHILEAILQDDSGMSYICSPTCDLLLKNLMRTWKHLVTCLALDQDFSPRLLFHILRCYVLLCTHARGFNMVRENLPDSLTDGSFVDLTKKEGEREREDGGGKVMGWRGDGDVEMLVMDQRLGHEMYAKSGVALGVVQVVMASAMAMHLNLWRKQLEKLLALSWCKWERARLCNGGNLIGIGWRWWIGSILMESMAWWIPMEFIALVFHMSNPITMFTDYVRAKKRTQRKKHKVRWMVENPMAIPQAILELQHPSMRESALHCLSDFLIWKREEDRENYDRTAFLLFNSCSTMAVLLQPFSQLSVDGTPAVRASKRFVNVLTLFQVVSNISSLCIASSKQTRYKFVKSFIPNFVVPLIRFEIPLENYEDVRAVALSVIGILCQAREPEVIQWALNSNMVESCWISMEIGSELSKVVRLCSQESHQLLVWLWTKISLPASYFIFFAATYCSALTLDTWIRIMPAIEIDVIAGKIVSYVLTFCRGFNTVRENLPDSLTDGSFVDLTKVSAIKIFIFLRLLYYQHNSIYQKETGVPSD
ncbi:hypothetical protein RHGRI_000142 [Rhododendron griersonianum]|uniref:Uncharacterized protein n=1 Tax=Rhododendron griersonianum TaxID=479676 RepID=A0AAV6LI88_9ERIC|nr:hypothetical protein RHGRI_000142 [Rhododendron griersonianum]